MILQGDCLQRLKELPDNSIDSIVTDPPYGWRFMGKAWDGDDIVKMARAAKGKEKRLCADGVMRAPREKPAEAAGKYNEGLEGNRAFQEFSMLWAKEAIRVLKPGGHALVFCGPRTYHRMACGLEEAGFQIRDQAQWLFGSGFPKSHNLTGDHQGWGTALKPANEPICVARKPIEKGLTVAENVIKWGCGALNIDESRIELTGHVDSRILRQQPGGKEASTKFGQIKSSAVTGSLQGRWPANVIFDEEAAQVLDQQSGILKSGQLNEGHKQGVGKTSMLSSNTSKKIIGNYGGDSGGASRFFYVAKASKRERNAGLENLEAITTNDGRQTPIDNAYQRGETKRQNFHPTVKPIKLMEYLIKLVTPKGGTVLDPFMGSGTTGVAAKRLGFKFIGCELNEEYIAIAQKRLEAA